MGPDLGSALPEKNSNWGCGVEPRLSSAKGTSGVPPTSGCGELDPGSQQSLSVQVGKGPPGGFPALETPRNLPLATLALSLLTSSYTHRTYASREGLWRQGGPSKEGGFWIVEGALEVREYSRGWRGPPNTENPTWGLRRFLEAKWVGEHLEGPSSSDSLESLFLPTNLLEASVSLQVTKLFPSHFPATRQSHRSCLASTSPPSSVLYYILHGHCGVPPGFWRSPTSIWWVSCVGRHGLHVFPPNHLGTETYFYLLIMTFFFLIHYGPWNFQLILSYFYICLWNPIDLQCDISFKCTI